MDDAILVSPHYNYDPAGRPIPAQEAADVQNLSMIVPLGILHLAQHLHDNGCKVRVVHLPHEFYLLQRLGLDPELLDNPVARILQKYPARVCGIQSHFYLYCGGAVRIAEIYREIFPDSTILVGGYMATACWEQFLGASPCIDGVVLGEGEGTLRHVVERTRSSGRGTLQGIDGLACRGNDGNPRCSPVRSEALLGVEQIPVIDPEARPFGNIIWPRRGFVTISRGRCPEKCAYCVANDREINPRPFRTMEIDRIIRQLRCYRRRGIRSVFLGENHFLDIPFLKALVERIIREDLDLYFELETHPAIFAEKGLLDRMIAAGFHRFTMGVESASVALMQRLGRRTGRTTLLETVRQIADAGGLVATSWICNLPGETEAEFQETRALLDTVVRAGGFIYWIENLHVLPGSRLHRNPGRWGIDVLLKTLEDWFRWALVSKTYVEPEEALAAPLRYLTHLNHHTRPVEMIRRLYVQRECARDLVPMMKVNLSERARLLPPDLVRTEMQKLDWYAATGWKLLLF